jgi:DNA-binding CsgD family transcriptional regulator
MELDGAHRTHAEPAPGGRASGWLRADRSFEPSFDATGWTALTPREREVVALVTHGATNKQAARILRLSPHTVSTHLRHVFTKLGICSRVELTRITVQPLG